MWRRQNDDAEVAWMEQFGAMAHRDLNVLDASERAEDRINDLIDCPSGRRLLHANQLRRAVHAISANISEAFGRGTDGDRVRVLRIARAEAEETIRHLSSNFRSKRISPANYWSIRNLLVVIVKMLNALVHR